MCRGPGGWGGGGCLFFELAAVLSSSSCKRLVGRSGAGGGMESTGGFVPLWQDEKGAGIVLHFGRAMFQVGLRVSHPPLLLGSVFEETPLRDGRPRQRGYGDCPRIFVVMVLTTLAVDLHRSTDRWCCRQFWGIRRRVYTYCIFELEIAGAGGMWWCIHAP